MNESPDLRLARFSQNAVSAAVSELDQAINYAREGFALCDAGNKDRVSRYAERLCELERARDLLVYGR